MKKFVGKIAITLAVLLTVSACAPVSPSITPTPTESTPSETPVTYESALVYFAVETPVGLRLVTETHEFELAGETLAEKVLSQLVSGELQPVDPDYLTLWGSPNELITVDVTAGAATVDLKPVTLNVGAEGEAVAISQIVWTLTEITGPGDAVSFLVDGQPAESFAGHVDILNSIKRGEESAVLNGIQISSLLDGVVVTNPVIVAGEACTFEANVRWTLLRDGQEVTAGSTLAAEACPTRSSWSVELPKLDPGSYEFVAQEYSMKDGTLLVEDTKAFIVE